MRDIIADTNAAASDVRFRSTRSRRLLAVVAAVVAAGCASTGEPDIATLASSSDKIIWEAGEKAAQKHQWENARKYFKRILDGFPQSEYGPMARIGVGDSYLQEGGAGNYILAISEYRDFLTLYPSHPRSDYAQFQVGECYYKQRNGSDRDQTSTEKALDEYQKLLDLYPNSSHVEDARSRVTECRQSLAKAEFMAGYFYQKTRRACRASITRYEAVLSEYPDYAAVDLVLLRLAECLAASGRPAEAVPHLSRLLTTYPESAFVAPARKLMEVLSRAVPAPAASPTPAPSPSPGAPG